MIKKTTYKLLTISLVSCQLLIIALIIYKRSFITHLLYKKQSLAKQIAQEQEKKERLEEQLLRLQDPVAIKKFCKKELGLQPLRLKQVKKMENAYDINDQ